MAMEKAIRWRSLEHGGFEKLNLVHWGTDLKVNSSVSTQVGDKRFGITYDMSLRPDWSFQSIVVKRTDGVMTLLNSDGQGNWNDGNGACPNLAGCIDIDFEVTPFTNTLPIRRLNFALGERRRLKMAYIPADTLEPIAYDQIYTKLNDTTYRFENADGSFTADITVDADGFVLEYPGLFSRVIDPPD